MRPSILAVSLLAAGCTFNVAVRAASGEATTTEAFTRVRSDLRAAGLRDGVVRVTGSARSGARATATGAALASGDAAPSPILAWAAPALGVAELRAASVGETAWLAEVSVEVPSGTEVDLDVRAADVEVTATGAFVRARADGGEIRVTGAGDVDLETLGSDITAEGRGGRIAADFGEVVLAMDGAVTVTALGGRISGRFAGGSITTTGGAIDVSLDAAPVADASLESSSGAITLRLPPGASVVLDLASSVGRISVDAGGASFDGSGSVTRTIGGGEHTVRIRNGDGAIAVLDL